jgi:hypothetical protein
MFYMEGPNKRSGSNTERHILASSMAKFMYSATTITSNKNVDALLVASKEVGLDLKMLK